MKLTKCPNKHFFDADKYPECPKCNTGAVVQAPKPGPLQQHVPSAQSGKPMSGGHGSQQRREKDDAGERTGSIWDQPDPELAAKPDAQSAPDELPVSEVVPEIAKIEDDSASPPEQPSLQTAVNAVISHDPKVTGSTEDVKTIAFYDLGGGEEPVVGWLVCVKGAYFGQSFHLKIGRNNVGRAGNMDIVLAQEPTVSRNRHSIITYEPEKREFFIQPGESSGLTYLNKSLVMHFQPMQAYDGVRLGTAEFVFVPCCGAQFSWEDYVK